MPTVHAGVRSGLPMSLDLATAVLVFGLVVFLLILYDIYRSRAAGGDPWL